MWTQFYIDISLSFIVVVCDLSRLDFKIFICKSDEHYNTYVKYVEVDIIISIFKLETEALSR